MSEVTDMILGGLMCQICGAYMDDLEEPGHPRTCEDCEEEDE